MNGTHLVLLPGMLLDADLFAHQKEHLRDVAEVRVCDITTADTVEGMARAVLDDAPERFAMTGRVGPEAFLRQLRAQADRPDSRERLGEISCPTLVAGGRPVAGGTAGGDLLRHPRPQPGIDRRVRAPEQHGAATGRNGPAALLAAGRRET